MSIDDQPDPESEDTRSPSARDFDRFVEAMDLDVDPAGMDEEERRSFQAEKRVLLRSMEKGHLVIDDRGRPVFSPQLGEGKPLVWHEPNGAALMEMDRAKAGKNVKASYLVMAAITKSTPARFASMRQRDLKVCNALLNLFMGG